MVATNSSAIDIANLALGRLGAGRIASFVDGTQPATIMNLYYEITRQQCLNAYAWQFAKKRASLPQLTEAPAFGFQYQYELPSDFLRLLQVGDYYPRYDYSLVVNKNTSEYQIEGNRILTNMQAPLNITYIADIQDTTKFTPLFAKYFYTTLAFEACEQITQSNTKADALFQEATLALKKAIMAEKVQMPPEQMPSGAVTDARLI